MSSAAATSVSYMELDPDENPEMIAFIQNRPLRPAPESRDPFVQIPQWILFHPKLSSTAIRVYGVLHSYLSHTRGDALAWPKQETIAALCGGLHRNTIGRAIKELEEYGLVEVRTQRYAHNNVRRCNVYAIREKAAPGHEGPMEPPTGVRTPRVVNGAGHKRTTYSASESNAEGASGRPGVCAENKKDGEQDPRGSLSGPARERDRHRGRGARTERETRGGGAKWSQTPPGADVDVPDAPQGNGEALGIVQRLPYSLGKSEMVKAVPLVGKALNNGWVEREIAWYLNQRINPQLAHSPGKLVLMHLADMDVPTEGMRRSMPNEFGADLGKKGFQLPDGRILTGELAQQAQRDQTTAKLKVGEWVYEQAKAHGVSWARSRMSALTHLTRITAKYSIQEIQDLTWLKDEMPMAA